MSSMKKTVLTAAVSAVLLGLTTPGYAQDASCPPSGFGSSGLGGVNAGAGLCEKFTSRHIGSGGGDGNSVLTQTLSLAPNILTKLSSIDTFSTSVTDLTRRINESDAARSTLEDGAVMYDDKTTKDKVTFNSGGSATLLTNVASGSLNDDSSDAINGHQVNKLSDSIADGLGGGAVFDANTGTVTAPTYVIQGNTYNNVGDALTTVDQATTKIINGKIGLVKTDSATVTVDKDGTATAVDLGGANGSRVVTGIADGVGTNDAVNKGQLDALAAQTDDRFQALGNRTDSQIRDLSSQMHANRKIAAQGVASAMAMQIDMPQPEPGHGAGGIGLGTYDGQTALALGARYRSQNGAHHFSAAISAGLSGHVKIGARVSFGMLF